MSFNYNQVTLIGRLTQDPEMLRVLDKVKATLYLAINRPYKKEDGTSDTDFIAVIVWGKLAEIVQQYTVKGSPLLVSGRIQVRSYEYDDKKHWITEVLADNIQFLGKEEKINKEQVK